MIIGNSTVTDIGDTLIISKILSLESINSFSTFTDNVTNENGSVNSFKKEFRYSFDGVNYSEFIICNNSNFLAIDLGSSKLIYFNFLYTVFSLTPSNTMTFVSITLNGNIEIKINSNFSITKNSAYKRIYRDNKDLLLLTDNLNRKLYYKGIVPEYIERNEEENSDEDLVSLFRACSEFFGLNSILVQQFENLYEIYYLLFEYLIERGIEVGSVQELNDLQYIVKNFYDEVRKRSTIQSFLKKGWRIPYNRKNLDYALEQPVDGELLRMIEYQRDVDEFIFHLFKNSEIGWWVDNCSPLYRGNTHIDSQINKGLIDEKDFIGESSFNINEGIYTGSSINSDTDGDKKVLSIDSSAGYLVKNNINDSLSYELTFFIKTENTFDVSIIPQDVNGNDLNIKDKSGSVISNNKVINAGAVASSTNYYFVRCILYGKNSMNIVEKTNLGIGKNAINTVGAIKCTWKIDSEGAYVWDIKIKPLDRPYETGFVQPANWVEFYLGNKNGKYNLIQIKDYIRKYLIPYNATLSIVDFAPVINNVSGVEAIITFNTADLFGNLTMFGEDYIDPVNGKVEIIDMEIIEN